MKNIKKLLLMFTLVFAVASCTSDDDGGMDNQLLGTWEVTEAEDGMEVSIVAKFNANDTGTMATVATFGGEPFIDQTFDFTYSVDGDQLTMTMDGDTEISTYSVSGDRLTITDSEGDSFVLTKV